MRSLHLEGANWDFENSCLCEPVPLKFISDLPIMHFKPVQNSAKKKGERDGANSSAQITCGRSLTSVCVLFFFFAGVYQCPVYYYARRCGAQGRDAYVVTMSLNSGSEPPDHWIKRATAVLLNLST